MESDEEGSGCGMKVYLVLGGERTFYICRPLATDTKPQEFEILLLKRSSDAQGGTAPTEHRCRCVALAITGEFSVASNSRRWQARWTCDDFSCGRLS